MKAGVFITVRTGSSRLPQKALREVNGRPIISYLITRFKKIFGNKLPIIVCTTTLKEDDILGDLAKEYGVQVFHGDPENIIKRHYECGKAFGIDFIINIDGDDILCDPEYALKIYETVQNSNADVIKTVGLPFGVNSMGYHVKVLERILEEYDSEKLDTGWGAMIVDKNRFNVNEIQANPGDMMDVRLSLDYQEDFELFRRIIEVLFQSDNYVPHQEIMEYLKKNPELTNVNAHLNEIYWQNYHNKKAEEGR